MILPSFLTKLIRLNKHDTTRVYVKTFRDDSKNKSKTYLFAIVIDFMCIAGILLFGFMQTKDLTSSPLAAVIPLVNILGNAKAAPNVETVTLPSGETINMPDLKGLTTRNLQHKDYITSKSQKIMNLPPKSETRTREELKLLQYLKDNNASAADILLATEVVMSKPARAWAMETLWVMRQSGKLSEFYIYPFSNEKIAWAKKRNIDPRVLAISSDLHGPVLKLIQAKPELFFEAAKNSKAKDPNPQKYIPNPAVIARLQMTETGWHFSNILSELNDLGVSWDFESKEKTDRGFVNIGSVTAWGALNLSDSWFPSGQNDLIWIASELENQTGLPYKNNVKVIPGSFRGSGDGSGGAIGPQLMPINARLFMTWYKEANQSSGNTLPEPSPFNPWTGTMLSYLYIVSEFYHRQMNIDNVTSVVRPGYAMLEQKQGVVAFHPKKDPRIRALLKWNPLAWQAKAAVVAGQEFNSLWYSNDTLALKSDK